MDLADQLGNAVGDLAGTLHQHWRRLSGRLPFWLTAAGKRNPHGRNPSSAATPAGVVMLIGGTQLADDMIVQMLHLAGGRLANVVVIPTASLDFAKAGERYVRAFARFGMERVQVLELVTRERAGQPEWLAPLASADLIFLGGGDAGRILDILGGTPAAQQILAASQRGATVVAMHGAACILGQWVAGSTDYKGQPVARPGLGVLPGIMVGPCGVRGGQQVGQLLLALSDVKQPEALALALDDGTSVVLQPGGLAHVSGQGCLLVGERAARSADGSLSNLPVHVVPSGRTFNLRACTPQELKLTATTSKENNFRSVG